ncbi:asparaginase, partial [bacterium]|nr:asparaginase [bacterium]MBU1024828.1 asparaginase [bacterium]
MLLKDELLIDVLRSGTLESQHIGSIVAVNFDGKIIAKVGDPERRSYMRSSIKPIQALPTYMDDSCMRRFKFNARERAYMMSSHSGERCHQQVGTVIQKKLGITDNEMGCGIHPPYHTKTRNEMQYNREPFTPLCNNCSGNHLVMLTLSIHNKWDIGNYIHPDHPYQQEVLKWISLFSGINKNKIRTGMDNCSVPAYNLTLREMALIFARFSAHDRLDELPNPDNLDIQKAKTVIRRIIADFWAHPEMIGGEGRLCTYLNRIGKDRFFSKAGGEAMQVTGILDKGIGIAVKIADGDHATRAKNTAVMDALYQLGLISDKDLKKAGKLYKPDIPNLRGFDAQTIVPRFK